MESLGKCYNSKQGGHGRPQLKKIAFYKELGGGKGTTGGRGNGQCKYMRAERNSKESETRVE